MRWLQFPRAPSWFTGTPARLRIAERAPIKITKATTSAATVHLKSLSVIELSRIPIRGIWLCSGGRNSSDYGVML